MSFEIEKVAELARIHLKGKEKEKLQKDLDSILKYVEQLKEVDTSAVPETSHVLDLTNIFREDEVHTSEAAEDILKTAPARESGFFKVPKVVDRS